MHKRKEILALGTACSKCGGRKSICSKCHGVGLQEVKCIGVSEIDSFYAFFTSFLSTDRRPLTLYLDPVKGSWCTRKQMSSDCMMTEDQARTAKTAWLVKMGILIVRQPALKKPLQKKRTRSTHASFA